MSVGVPAETRAARSIYSSGGEESSDRLVGIVTAVFFTVAVSFFTVVTTIAYLDPDFFDRLLLADIGRTEIDPIMVGATEKPDEVPGVEPIPVPSVVRGHALVPADFSIVMIYGEEAHLASPGELWRIKTGMIVPGLGKVLAIEEGEEGGTIKTENAVLRGVAE